MSQINFYFVALTLCGGWAYCIKIFFYLYDIVDILEPEEPEDPVTEGPCSSNACVQGKFLFVCGGYFIRHGLMKYYCKLITQTYLCIITP